MKKYFPKQRDIIFISFNPTSGHEQSGQRPAIVLSADEYNTHSGMMIVAPITSKGKGYEFEISISNLKTKGVILCDHIRTVDWFARKPSFIEKCDVETFLKAKNTIFSLLQ